MTETMRLYHTTTPGAARAILVEGYQDHLDGVWLADMPTDDGARGTGTVLCVDVPLAVVAPYEVPVIFERWDADQRRWVPDDERLKYRAWCVPVTVLQPFALHATDQQPAPARPLTRVRLSRIVPREHAITTMARKVE